MDNQTKSSSAFRWYLWILLFILPLKFGWQIGSQEQANFPMNFAEWLLFIMWPQQLLWLLSAAALLLAAWHRRGNSLEETMFLRVRGWLPICLTLLPVLAGIFGLVRTTEWNYVWSWYGNCLSALMIATAVAVTIPKDKALLDGIFTTMALSCLLCALNGWYQHYYGLSSNLETMKMVAAAQGLELDPMVLEKLGQTRVHGTFADPNIYAAHLLLTVPMLLKKLWDWGKNFEPKQHSPKILVALGAILVGAAIYWSGSRSAVLGIGAMAGAWLWHRHMMQWKPIARIAIVAILAVAMFGGLLAMTKLSNRDLSTASVRIEYYTTAMKMFKMHPVSGVGLGEYFPWHLRLKPEGADEARDAHSQFFMMLSQCGLPGGVAAALRIALPGLLLLGLLKKRRNSDDAVFLAACAGWLAWNVHSLFQFDDIVLSLAAYVAIVPFFPFSWEDAPDVEKNPTAAARLLRRFAPHLSSMLDAIQERHRQILGHKTKELTRPNNTLHLARHITMGTAILGIVFSAILLKTEKSMQEGENSLAFNPARAAELLTAPSSRLLDFSLRAPYPWRQLGDAAMQMKDFKSAEHYYERLVELTPHRASSWRRLAESRQMQNKFQEAANAAENARLWYPTKK